MVVAKGRGRGVTGSRCLMDTEFQCGMLKGSRDG